MNSTSYSVTYTILTSYTACGITYCRTFDSTP